jgi:hypothetical protein
VKGFFYLTERIIMCPFPDEDVIQDISDYLNNEHLDHYIVYNLSEHTYDNSYFNNSVTNITLIELLGYGIFISWLALSTIRYYIYDMHINDFMVINRLK